MTSTESAESWLAQAQRDVRRDPATMVRAFAVAGRKVGRGPLHPHADPHGIVHGGIDDSARASLVLTLVESRHEQTTPILEDLFHRGDSAERRGVLRGLNAVAKTGLGLPDDLVEAGVGWVADALRANEQGLVAAAVGPFAAAYLDQHTWRHAVLKLVFMEVSLDAVADLERRCDPEVARMARDFAAERRAAGRPVPSDVSRLIPEGSA